MNPPRTELPAVSIIVPIAPGARPLVFDSLRAHETRPVACEVLSQSGPNASRNRNQRVAVARAPLLAFTDDDCRVPPDWLARAERFFAAHPDYDALGGPQLDAGDEGAIGRASGHALASWFGSFRQCRRYKQGSPNLRATQADLTSANLFLTRRAFDTWGPFDERLWPNEETALLRRIELAGGKIAYDPELVVYHRRRASLRGLGRQCFGYGRGRARQSFLEGGLAAALRPSLSQALPCLFLFYLLLLPLLVFPSALALIPLAFYAFLATTSAVVALWRKQDLAAALLLPLVFPIIHLGYAAGLLWETVRIACGGPLPEATWFWSPAGAAGQGDAAIDRLPARPGRVAG